MILRTHRRFLLVQTQPGVPSNTNSASVSARQVNVLTQPTSERLTTTSDLVANTTTNPAPTIREHMPLTTTSGSGSQAQRIGQGIVTPVDTMQLFPATTPQGEIIGYFTSPRAAQLAAQRFTQDSVELSGSFVGNPHGTVTTVTTAAGTDTRVPTPGTVPVMPSASMSVSPELKKSAIDTYKSAPVYDIDNDENWREVSSQDLYDVVVERGYFNNRTRQAYDVVASEAKFSQFGLPRTMLSETFVPSMDRVGYVLNSDLLSTMGATPEWWHSLKQHGLFHQPSEHGGPLLQWCIEDLHRVGATLQFLRETMIARHQAGETVYSGELRAIEFGLAVCTGSHADAMLTDRALRPEVGTAMRRQYLQTAAELRAKRVQNDTLTSIPGLGSLARSLERERGLDMRRGTQLLTGAVRYGDYEEDETEPPRKSAHLDDSGPSYFSHQSRGQNHARLGRGRGRGGRGGYENWNSRGNYRGARGRGGFSGGRGRGRGGHRGGKGNGTTNGRMTPSDMP